MEYNIIVNSLDGSKAVEIVLERLNARWDELHDEANDSTERTNWLRAFNMIGEAIECELVKVRATKEAH